MVDRKRELVIGGKIHGTHGVKGDLKVEVYPPNFKLPLKIYIKDENGDFKPLEIEAYSKRKGLIKFKNYDDLEKAKNLKHRYFYIYREQLPELEDDEYYIFQLIDKDVYFNEKFIGKVLNIDDRLSYAQLIIKCADGKVRYLPFINQFVKEVDEKNNRIIVDLPNGWLTL